MPSERPDPLRGRPDRRARPTSVRDALRLGRRGRRQGPRRGEEGGSGYFVDRIDPTTFVLGVALLTLTVVDGTLTLLLIEAGCEEVNPAMGYLLNRGPIDFLMGKYLLTCAGLPFLVVFRHFPLFRTRFRVGYLLPAFVALYVILLGYQVALLVEPDPAQSTRSRTSPEDSLSAFPSSTRKQGVTWPEKGPSDLDAEFFNNRSRAANNHREPSPFGVTL